MAPRNQQPVVDLDKDHTEKPWRVLRPSVPAVVHQILNRVSPTTSQDYDHMEFHQPEPNRLD